MSLGFGTLFSFFTPLIQYFRFLFLIPIIAIIIAFSLKNTIHRSIIFLGFLIFSSIYLLLPQYHREDWKGLAKSLPDNKVYMFESSSDPILYYRDDIKIIDLRTIADAKPIDSEIIVVPYTADVHGIDYMKILSGKKYKLVKQSVFRGLITEKWKRYSAM